MTALLRLCLLALALLAPVSAVAAQPEPVRPALWVVRDADTTVYLFGSFHLLPADLDWFNGPLRGAFDRADELVLEVALPDPAPAETQALMEALARDPAGRPLGERIGTELAARASEAGKAAGFPADGFDQARPWFVAIALELAEALKLGFSPASGAEQTLARAARTAGKPVRGIETAAGQIRLLAALPAQEEVALLRLSLDALDRADRAMPGFLKLWAAGDVDRLSSRLFDETRPFPTLRRSIVTDRNRTFADHVAARLRAPGVSFVAVGAGHLGGKQGMLALLRARGLRPERLQ